jgi:peptidylprolyl isomerase
MSAPQQPTKCCEDGGVVKVILEEGTGDALPQHNNEVDVNYWGRLEDGTEFDKNEDQDEPFQFFIGTEEIIKGWNVAVPTMKRGEKARFTIKSDYAYGAAGSPPSIPANATLVFDIKLIDFREREKSKWDYTPEERVPLAKEMKETGNEFFKAKNFEAAEKEYAKALDYLEFVKEPEVKDIETAIRSNLALVYMKLNNHKEAVKVSQKCIQADPKYIKGYFRLATAFLELKDYRSAMDASKAGIEHDSANADLREIFKKAQQALKDETTKEKNIYQKMFQNKELYDPVARAEYHNESNPIVFLEIQIGSAEPQRIEIELFKSICPKTTDNFRALCTGEKGNASFGKPLHFKGSIFHRNINEFMLQGGDFQNANGTGGESIYGNKFNDENFLNKHVGRGILSMANSGPNTNGSQFFICYKKTDWLDGKHVVFGKVVKNIEFLDQLEAVPVKGSDVPVENITIVNCGIVKE